MSRAVSAALGLVLGLSALAAAPATAQSAPLLAHGVPLDSPLNCGTAAVTKTLSTGSAWRMCVRVDDFKGLVLEHLQFRPATGDREYSGWMPVLDSLALAQLNVPYDTGEVAFDDLTGSGLGGTQLVTQNSATCPGSILSLDQSLYFGETYVQRHIPGICVATSSTGLAWQSEDYPGLDDGRYAEQGQAVEISSISKVGWYEYQQKVALTDQGTITVSLGATGDIGQDPVLFPTDPSLGWQLGAHTGEPPDSSSPDSPGAASHWHNAIYRVDFGIDSGPQRVERWDYQQPSPSSNKLEGTSTTQARAFIAPPSTSRLSWWRVLNPTSLDPDGHPRSYEIVNDSVQDTLQPATSSPISFTNDLSCEEYAWDNLNVDCPGQSIPEYVAADTEPLTDPVAWVNVGFHHIVRNEDQSPMPTHWQEFSLVPRDFLAQQATTPIERSCINGGPLNPGGSCAAINTAPPTIDASPGPIRPGSVLTALNGSWKSPRAPLSFQRIWLRDGVPITAPGLTALLTTATGLTYTVTPADQGHRISVRVDAGGPGLVPGSATSPDLVIPPATHPATRPPRRATATLTLTQAAARLRIRARGSIGVVTGVVVVRGPGGWKRTRALSKGTVSVRLPRAFVKKKRRLVVSYPGDSRYLPVQRQTRLHHLRR